MTVRFLCVKLFCLSQTNVNLETRVIQEGGSLQRNGRGTSKGHMHILTSVVLDVRCWHAGCNDSFSVSESVSDTSTLGSKFPENLIGYTWIMEWVFQASTSMSVSGDGYISKVTCVQSV